jgi:hypothetical protein
MGISAPRFGRSWKVFFEYTVASGAQIDDSSEKKCSTIPQRKRQRTYGRKKIFDQKVNMAPAT